MPPFTTPQIPPLMPDELDKLSMTVRKILGKGHDFGYECTCLMRSLTVNAVPGNGRYANLAIITVAGTPTRGAVAVSMTHDGDAISRHLSTGRKLTQKDVDTLRYFVRRLSCAETNRSVSGNL